MPDVTSLLERAAVPPRGEPDVEGALRRGRRTRSIAVAATVAVAVVVASGVALAARSHRSAHRVAVAAEETSTTTAPARMSSHDASIDVAPGWYTSSEPLAWWLISPFELFSIATSPLPPAPHAAANEAACPSEIPQVAVDAIPDDGAYLWIGEWRPHGGIYRADPRPAHSDELHLQPGCPLPRGMKTYVTILRDGTHDYSVTFVLGRDAPASRRADIDAMLDSLRFAP